MQVSKGERNLVKMRFNVCSYISSLVSQMVKNLPAIWETWVQSLVQEDPLGKEMETHSNILAWRIPWALQSMGSQRVRHNWSDLACVHGWFYQFKARANLRSVEVVSDRNNPVPILRGLWHLQTHKKHWLCLAWGYGHHCNGVWKNLCSQSVPNFCGFEKTMRSPKRSLSI